MDEDSRKAKIHQGRNIRFFRNAKNLKQEDFAERIGLKQPVVTKIERQSVLEESILLKCAEVLGIPVDVLKNFDSEQMFDCFIYNYNIDKIQNSGGGVAVSHLQDSTNNNTNNYPIEKLMELHNKNTELYERLLQAERDKSAFFEKMLDDKRN